MSCTPLPKIKNDYYYILIIVLLLLLLLQAEGVQSYFNVNGYADPPDGLHNRINTRVKLRSYDPELFQLVHDIFPCANHFIKRCHSRGQSPTYQTRRI